MTFDQLDRAHTEGRIDEAEYRARLAIMLNAGAAHDAIERWYSNLTGRTQFEARPLPFTTLEARWSNIAFNEVAQSVAKRYGPNWNFNGAVWEDVFIPEYETRIRALEVQRAIEDGI